ncbi:TRAP transporter large permease subunit [Pannonibacter sp. Pt2-lr]
MTAPLLWIFIILMAIAVPVAHAMLGGVAAALWLEGKPMAVIMQRLYTPMQSFPMLAIPFFILAGSLMMSGRFGVYLVNIARLLVGHMKGGLGQVSIIGSVIFGGVSGSAVADATALGNALIPVQKKQGYPAGFAAAINSASSTVSVLIPPSIPLILYGLVANVSIIDLFVAGILPGVMLASGMFAAVWFVARRKNLPRSPLEGDLPPSGKISRLPSRPC